MEEERAYIDGAMQSVMATFINKKRYSNCEGCTRGFPSQRDHECLVEDAEFHVNKYFIEALEMITPQLMRAIFAFFGKSFPSMDSNAHKIAHTETLRTGLEDIIDGTKADDFIEFYECMKTFL